MGTTVDIREVTLFRDARGWGVALGLQGGRRRRLRYGSEAQARFFAAVLALGPRQLPQQGRRALSSRNGGGVPRLTLVPAPRPTPEREVEEVWLDEVSALAPAPEVTQEVDLSAWVECL